MDQRDHQIVKVEADVIDTIWIGLFLVRVAKGSRATLELTRVSDGVWLPDRLQVVASAWLGLLKTYRFEQRVHYSRYSCTATDARTIYPAESYPGGKPRFALPYRHDEPTCESALPMSAARPPPRSCAAMFFRIGFQRVRVRAGAAVRKVRASRLGRVHWKRGLDRPIEVLTQHQGVAIEVSAAVDNVLDELTGRPPHN